MLVREGYALTAGAFGVALVSALVAAALGGWGRMPAVFGAVLLGVTLWSFRDTWRTPSLGGMATLLGSADGRVAELVVKGEPLYLRSPARHVSVTLAPLSAHAGRPPAAAEGHLKFRSRRDIVVSPHVALDVSLGQGSEAVLGSTPSPPAAPMRDAENVAARTEPSDG